MYLFLALASQIFCAFHSIHSFSYSNLDARCVLLDMEEKVVSKSIAEASKSGVWRYNPKHAFVRESGAGNNWAFGYVSFYFSYCSFLSPFRYQRLSKEMVDVTLEMARKEIEETDDFEGFLLLHSLAGGTGSGVGLFFHSFLFRLFLVSSPFNFYLITTRHPSHRSTP